MIPNTEIAVYESQMDFEHLVELACQKDSSQTNVGSTVVTVKQLYAFLV